MAMQGQPPEHLADGRFKVLEQLGEGSFGKVCKGFDNRTSEHVAIKFETGDANQAGSLRNEEKLLDLLRRPYPRHGFVECLYYKGGFDKTTKINTSVMVMELLGTSLEDSVVNGGGKFDVGTTVLIAEQALHRMEYLHSKCIVHRDIKPDNFMWGIGRKLHHLYLIDFGLSIRFWDRKHVPESRTNSLTGTARYASINAHRGITQARRDDLEAIGHMLLYFLRGSLPWSGLKAKTQKEKFQKIADKKASTSPKELCDGFPEQFKNYLVYCRNLGFKERPDYMMLQRNFNDLRVREKVAEDWELPWIKGNHAVDVKTLMPHDPGCGHLQPDDVPGRMSRHCFRWRRSMTGQSAKMPDKE